MNNKEVQKKKAAKLATKFIEDDQIIGVGSGSTIDYFIKFLKERITTEKLNILAVPTSYQSTLALIENQISLTSLNEYPELDLAVDGADEIDSRLNLIKGGGAALTQEKIVDSAAKKFIVIADESKLVNNLGEKMSLPIEIIPIALKTVLKRLKQYSDELVLREAIKKMGPVVTDNGNFIIDAKITEIKNPKILELELNGIPGVIENGLFVDLADVVIVGKKDETIELTR